MRRDLNRLHERFEAIGRLKREIWCYLSDTKGPWAEEHYDEAHAAAREAEEALKAIYRDLHKWAREQGYKRVV